MVASAVIFDLDDTLYLEQQYVASGFLSVARLISGATGLSSEAIYTYLMKLIRAGIRGRSFDMLIGEFSGIRDVLTVQDLVAAYREHQPDIKLLPGISELLRSLRQAGLRVGLLSDGALVSQRRKIDALGLGSLLDPVVLTDAWGREYWKPHIRGFEHIENACGLPASALVYVGDNPLKDFVTPNKMGWHTVRLRVPGQLHFDEEPRDSLYAPQMEARSVRELTEVLLA